MTSLGELREALDKIDNEIAELYEKRMEVCRKVGEYKVKSGKKVFDRQREKEKLADVMSKVEGDFNKKGIQELYQQLMSMSRKLQYSQLVEAGALGRLPFIRIENLDRENARVVFQGTEGAYSQAAMYQFFGRDVNNFHVRTFREAMEAIEEGSADYAVLPIENSTAGTVNEMYDLLDEFENYIVAETILPVVHTLSGLPGAKLSDIKKVYSKTEALMQTSEFLDDHGDWQKISVVNTAVAAKKGIEEQDISQAAVWEIVFRLQSPVYRGRLPLRARPGNCGGSGVGQFHGVLGGAGENRIKKYF